jgi:hypothetical protein
MRPYIDMTGPSALKPNYLQYKNMYIPVHIDIL